MRLATISNRTCDECGKEHAVFIEVDEQPETQDFNESWTCPLCGFHNHRFAVPFGED